MHIQQLYNNLQSLPPKEKYERIKQLAHEISKDIDQIETSEVDVAISVINEATKITEFTQSLTLTRASLVQKKLESLGVENAETKLKQDFEVQVESGVIIVGDPEKSNGFDFKDYSEPEFIRFMQEGRGLIFGTAGDGTFDTQIRLVNAPEPVLSKDENKLIVGTTDTIVTEILSGFVKIADLHNLSKTPNTMAIENGKYKVCGYLIDNNHGLRSFYITLAKTTTDNLNEEVSFYTLE